MNRTRTRLGLLGALIWITGAVVSAGVGSWTTNGPTGQQGMVVVDPAFPGTLYSGTASGMAISRDSGQTWAATASGAPPLYALAARSGIVYAYSVDFENNPFIRSVLWKSAGAGATWIQLSSGTWTDYRITIDPSSISTVYRASSVTLIPNRLINGSLDRSLDGGQTWASVDAGVAGNVVSALAIDPRNSAVLYLANVHEGIGVPPPPPGFFRSIDAGATWMPLISSLGVVNGLVIDPVTGRLYAAASTGLYRSTDGGASFTQINPIVLATLLLDTAHPNRLYGSLSGNQAGVAASADGGGTWTSLNDGLSGDALSVTSLAIDSTGRFLHATTARPGVFDYEIVSDPRNLSLDAAHPFTVTLSAINPHTGEVADGAAMQGNDLWGYFSIPAITNNPNNPEVFVKMLDGTALNGSYWFFYGGLTDLEYTLTVTEDATGRQTTYTKPAGSECGGSDTAAFAP